MNICQQGYKNNTKCGRRYRHLLLLLIFWATVSHAWQVLSNGIEYQDLGSPLLAPWSHIHAFRIDLKSNQLELMMAKQVDLPSASVKEFANLSHALIALNGGFFDQHFKPLGLRISGKQRHNPMKPISWWGIFYIKDNQPAIVRFKQFHPDPSIQVALQSGPRLLVHGHIPTLKPGLAERSAIGITKDNAVILLVTENAPLTTTALAQLLQSAPLSCTDALNLDGGSSSQIHANIDQFNINAHGFAKVSDAILVKARR